MQWSLLNHAMCAANHMMSRLGDIGATAGICKDPSHIPPFEAPTLNDRRAARGCEINLYI